MSAALRNFMEAYNAVHNKEVKEELLSKRDELTEMDFSLISDVELDEIAEAALQDLFEKGFSVNQADAIFEHLITEAKVTYGHDTESARAQKVQRLKGALKGAVGKARMKAARGAVAAYGAYRGAKQTADDIRRRTTQTAKNISAQTAKSASEAKAGVKSGLKGMIKKAAEKVASKASGVAKKMTEGKGDGNLANNYPPYDKVTRGDIIAGAKGEDQMGGKKKKKNIGEATAMAKRGYDEAPIRQKIAKSTGGGEAADRASALEKKSTFGDAKKAKQRSDYARKQRGDFRNTTSSNPGLHGYGHQSNDPKVKAKQAARGAQRGSAALTPNERKQLNMEMEYDVFDMILEFLRVEGIAETLEEAEWMMANLLGKEEIDIIVEAACECEEEDEEDEKEMKKGKKSEKEDEEIEEAAYSAKAGRAGKDIGKPGKAFAKIAKSAAKRYGSKERGEKVAGAVLAKLRANRG